MPGVEKVVGLADLVRVREGDCTAGTVTVLEVPVVVGPVGGVPEAVATLE